MAIFLSSFGNYSFYPLFNGARCENKNDKSPLIIVEGRKCLEVSILKDCAFCIPVGQLWMLLGPNGCGKSTLLKALAGALKPTYGTMCIKKPQSFVFQNPDHKVEMSMVEADVAFGLGQFYLTESKVRKRVTKALEVVGMVEYMQRPNVREMNDLLFAKPRSLALCSRMIT